MVVDLREEEWKSAHRPSTSGRPKLTLAHYLWLACLSKIVAVMANFFTPVRGAARLGGDVEMVVASIFDRCFD
jgi:hypothetical protein